MTYKTIILLGLALVSLFIATPWAFALGLGYAIAIGNPHQKYTAKINKLLLQVCVVGLGFGINMYDAIDVGAQSIILTLTTIIVTISLALWLGKRLGLESQTSLLIGAGTAICGGSAIAAVAAAINAKPNTITLALTTVFGLNAIALFIFPPIGHLLGLTDTEFGLWSAIAIHDTSSVVGAAQTYGEQALNIATTTKLQRALWIIPLVLVIARFYDKDNKGTVTIPWFIVLFVLAIAVTTWIPSIAPITALVTMGAKKGLTLALFLIGASFQFNTLKTVGAKPFVLGVVLWAVISVGSLSAIVGL